MPDVYGEQAERGLSPLHWLHLPLESLVVKLSEDQLIHGSKDLSEKIAHVMALRVVSEVLKG